MKMYSIKDKQQSIVSLVHRVQCMPITQQIIADTQFRS